MPQVEAVYLEQYRAAGVPVVSLATWMQESELERCWIYTNLGVLLLLVSIDFGIVYPWFLEFRSHVVQLAQFLDIALVLFLSLPWISSL